MDIQRERVPNRRRQIIFIGTVTVIAIGTVALAQLEPATRAVDRATIWTDTVKRGTMVREVRGPGNLVPEQVRWISSVSAGRIERIDVRPGAAVTAETILLEIRNPDVQIESLQADQQLTDAASRLVDLRTRLASDILSQKSTVAQVEAEYLNARRTATNNEALADMGLISEPELVTSRERAGALATRLDVERQRLVMIEGAMVERIRAQAQQIERLREVATFQHERVESMVVRAGVTGIVTELALEEGQWVNPGQNLARIVQPGRLKAVLRIPEVQARDLAIGQAAKIDTRNGIIDGRIGRLDPAVENGAVRVDVLLDGDLPRGARPDLSVDGLIELERLEDVLYFGRPAYGQPESTIKIFKILPNSSEAIRVPVRLGRSSVDAMEIKSGLQPGDIVILSDLSSYDSAERIRLR